MNKTCRNCGAPVPASASFFCNRCGARLPPDEPDLLICPRCGKTQSDLYSRFCDRCGSPMTPVQQPAPPARTAMQKKACPQCGFENAGDSIFFCKRCGAPLAADGSHDRVPAGRPQAGPARAQAATVQPRRESMAPRTAEAREILPVRRQEAQTKRWRLSRKMAIGIAAVIILLIIATSYILLSGPGTPAGGQENTSTPGLIGATLWNSLPGQTLFYNQGTPVVTDTPLSPKGT